MAQESDFRLPALKEDLEDLKSLVLDLEGHRGFCLLLSLCQARLSQGLRRLEVETAQLELLRLQGSVKAYRDVLMMPRQLLNLLDAELKSEDVSR